MRPTHARGKQSGRSLVEAKADCVTERDKGANNMAAKLKKTEKPRERTKALKGVVRKVLAPKNTFTDNYEAP